MYTIIVEPSATSTLYPVSSIAFSIQFLRPSLHTYIHTRFSLPSDGVFFPLQMALLQLTSQQKLIQNDKAWLIVYTCCWHGLLLLFNSLYGKPLHLCCHLLTTDDANTVNILQLLWCYIWIHTMTSQEHHMIYNI